MTIRKFSHVRRSGERGYVLIVFVLFTALLVAGTYRILPKMVFEGQRQKEEDLIFRGQQYRRAIQLFVRKFGRYPTSLEELENTNRMRFLRKRYRDPMTPEGEWRLIHIGPGGVFPDSLTYTGPPRSASGATPASFPGAPSPAIAGQGSAGQPASSGTSPSPGTPFQGPFGAFGQVGSPPATGPGQRPPGAEPALSPTANPGPNPLQPRATGFVAQQPGIQLVFGGGGIAGVASQSEAASIKVVNDRTQYNEWEFIYDYRTDPLGMAAVARASGVPAQQNPAGQPPQAPGQQAGPGSQPGQPPRFPGPQFPFGSSPPGLGSGAPGVRPGAPFPPSPVPRGFPAPQQR